MTESYKVRNAEYNAFLERMKILYSRCEVLERIPISHTSKEVTLLFWV